KPFEKGAPVQDLGVMNGPNSTATAISENGRVAGWNGAGNPGVGFLTDPKGRMALIPPYAGAATSSPGAVSWGGRVVGTGVILNPPSSLAYLWDAASQSLMTIEPLEGYTSSQGVDLNEMGQLLLRSSAGASNIIGGLWQNGAHHALHSLVADMPAHTSLARPRSLNEPGDILVEGHVNGKIVGIVLKPTGRPFTDLNGDCATNAHDLMMLLSQWGQIPASTGSSGVPSADFNQDGIVDVLDLLILLGNWG
ncbi:MAG TPA: dockerin type I domain-containing protein, partial [Phycisphaerales bacterium]|nr:dockerin type I domain-containing protein [Phycisphaerales bacterium]